MNLTLEQITELQKQYGVTKTQEGINSGNIWCFEGSVGRFADDCLRIGACYLPEYETQDYYGSKIPPRNVLREGTKGTLENSQAFWQKVLDCDDNCLDFLEDSFSPETQENLIETDEN